MEALLCSSCGRANSEFDSRCAACGAALSASATMFDSQPPTVALAGSPLPAEEPATLRQISQISQTKRELSESAE